MLRPTSRTWATLLLLAALMLPALVDARSPAKGEPIDLSILEQKDALIPHMTATQRIQYLKFERILEQAESDLRSGEHLANSKPPALDPDRDMRPVIKRGEQLIAQAETNIDATHLQMVQLLNEVEAQKAEQLAIDLTKFDFSVDTATFETALASHARKLMEACWALGYETLFFDGVYIRDNEGLRRADATIHNQTYDALVKIDGTSFSLTIPVDFQLKATTRGNSRHIFIYENAAIFENDKKALLALELIAPEGSSTGLFSLRAIDLDNQTIAAHALVKIDDIAGLLELPAEGAEGLADRIPDDVQLRDPEQKIDLFARLSNPYTFQIVDSATTGEAAACITNTLLQHSGLELVDSEFLLAAYGESLEQPETWIGQANAQLSLEPTAEAGAFQINAQANDSDRILALGTLNLDYPPIPETPAEEAPTSEVTAAAK